ncbi:MAG: hypothetical protein ACKN81_17765, partial [Pirellulaceae bacterium]
FPELVQCVAVNLDYLGLEDKPPEKYLPKKTFPPLVPRDPPKGRMRFVGDFAMGAREIGFLTLPQGGALRRNDESGRATSWF